jgi:hypothetical protein
VSVADLPNRIESATPTTEPKKKQPKQLISSQNATNTSKVAAAPYKIVAAKPVNKREKRAAASHFNKITQPWSNSTAVSYFQGHFSAGYRNQIMAFTELVMVEAVRNHHSQIILVGLRHKDTFGTNKNVEHKKVFDIEHWNSHYPQLQSW